MRSGGRYSCNGSENRGLTPAAQLAGRLAYEQCLALPLEWVHETPEFLVRAAEIKVTHPLTLAPAWIAAAVLVHKDPEFQALALPQDASPFKAAK